MNIKEIREMYRTALIWTDGNEARAKSLVDAYLKGTVDRAILESALA